MKKIEQQLIDKIREDFQKMRSKEDFLDLLNFVKKYAYSSKTYPFKLNQLNWYSSPQICSNNYTSFPIKKKTGGERIIHAPIRGLKALQKTTTFILQCVFDAHKAAYGFVPNKSIVDNARVHVGERYVYNIDLKDFFPSIDQARVWKCLQLHPFNLSNEVSENLEKESIKSNIKIFTKLNKIENNKKNNFSILNYQGTNLPTGKYKINLKEDGILVFKVYQKDKKRKFGKILILMKESKLDIIEKKAFNIIEKNETDLKLNHLIDYICSKLIKSFLEKSNVKSNRLKIANIIASICCFEMEVDRFDKELGEWKKELRNVLPQGAPTSPVLTNVICSKLDRRLSGVAKRFGLNYTRYADDITFSSSHNVYQQDGEFVKEMTRIIIEQGFSIKESKTRLQKQGYRQEVTGLLVGDKLNVQKRYVKQIRMWLYYWETYGFKKCNEIFYIQYLKDKGHVKDIVPQFSVVLKGKLDFLKMVVSEKSPVYLKFINRYNKLTNKIVVSEERGEYLDYILKELMDKGLNSAMSKFK